MPEGIIFFKDLDEYMANNYPEGGDVNFVKEPKNDIYVVFNRKDKSSTSLLIPETSKYFNFDFIQQKMSVIKHLAQTTTNKMALYNLKAVEQRLSHIANKVIATLG
jgi:hypothetical protein